MEVTKRTKGFTLVELIIVITILAILATIGFISFQGYVSDARDANRTATIKNIEKWLTLYKLKTNNYPAPDESTPFTGWLEWKTKINQWIVWENVARVINMNTIPLDPKDKTKKYVYSTFWDNHKYYQVAINAENNQTSFIPETYAFTPKSAIVKWNYKMDPSLPSLIVVPSSVTASGIFDPKVCFVMDGWKNSLDNCVEKKEKMSLKEFDNSLVWYWDMESWTWNILYDLSGNGNDWKIYSARNTVSSSITPSTFNFIWWYLWKAIEFTLSPDWQSGKVINLWTGATLSLQNNATFNVIIKTDWVWWWPTIIWKWTSFSWELINYSVGLWDLTHPTAWWWIVWTLNSFSNWNYTKINDNNYRLITFVFNWDNSYFYINWKLLISRTTNSKNRPSRINNPVIPTTIWWNYSLLWWPGWFSWDSYVHLFNWIIDDVKIYNRALTDEEIKQQAKIAGFQN